MVLFHAQPCPIMLIGPRASCALMILSAQDARGPMRMTRRTLIVSEPDIPALVDVRSSEDF